MSPSKTMLYNARKIEQDAIRRAADGLLVQAEIHAYTDEEVKAKGLKPLLQIDYGKPMHQSEHDEQVAVMDWIFYHLQEYPELDLVFAVPNGARLGSGKVAAIRANSLKAEGMRPGCPDLVIPSPRGGYFGMFLEMKAKGGHLHESQERFIIEAEKYGYFCAVAYGAEEAIEILEGYLSRPYTQVQK